jgi:hypothetical protein
VDIWLLLLGLLLLLILLHAHIHAIGPISLGAEARHCASGVRGDNRTLIIGISRELIFETSLTFFKSLANALRRNSGAD